MPVKQHRENEKPGLRLEKLRFVWSPDGGCWVMVCVLSSGACFSLKHGSGAKIALRAS